MCCVQGPCGWRVHATRLGLADFRPASRPPALPLLLCSVAQSLHHSWIHGRLHGLDRDCSPSSGLGSDSLGGGPKPSLCSGWASGFERRARAVMNGANSSRGSNGARADHHIATECRLRVFASAALGLTEVRGDLHCDEGGVELASACLLC